MIDASGVIDLAGAAARLRLPYHTAYKFVLTGRLEGGRRNGRWFVTVESVDSIIKSRGTDTDIGQRVTA